MDKEIDTKEIAEQLKKLKKRPALLKKVMREAGIGGKKGDDDDSEKYTEQAYKAAREKAAAEGKGGIRQEIAGYKAAKAAQEQYQIATMGTKKSREKILGMFGIQVGKQFQKNMDKKATEEEIKKARESLGLDRKEEEKKKGSGRTTVNGAMLGSQKLTKDVAIIKNVVQSLAKFVLVNRGYTSEIDPKTGKILYRKDGKFAKASEATFASSFKNSNSGNNKKQELDRKSSRTEALSRAIMADEDPMIKMTETLDAVLKSLGDYKSKSVQEKLDAIYARSSGGGGFGVSPGVIKGAAKVAGAAGKAAAKLGRGIAKVGAKVGGAVATVAGKVSGGAGAAAAKVAAKAAVGKEVIKKAAQKVLQSSVVKGAGKAVPFLGLAVGGYYAAKKLTEGDYVGAGLEAAGGAGGPLTAIPATVASAVRDIYQSIYGVYPETDPEAGKRFQEVKDVTTEVASEMLGGKKQEDKPKAPEAQNAAPKPAGPKFAAQPGAAPAGGAGGGAAPAAAPTPPSGPPTLDEVTPTGKIATTPLPAGAAPPPAGGGPAPSTAEANPKKVSANAGRDAVIKAMDKRGITDKTQRAAILAQVAQESGNFTTLSENLNYKSPSRLKQIFGFYKKNPQAAEQDAGNPQSIANAAYSNRNGNGPPESGDGWEYRGRGFIQLTGKANYNRFGVSNPDSLLTPDKAAENAVDYMMGFKGDWSDPAAVTKYVNGSAMEGLSQRTAYFNAFLNDPSIAPGGGAGATPAGGAAGGGTMVASTGGAASGSTPVASGGGTAPSSGAMAPVPSSTGQSMAAQSNEYAQQQMVAQNTPAAPVVVNAGGGSSGGGAGKAPPPQNKLAKAPTRSSESAFNRALAKDFAHPTAFTTVGTV